jgi:hypothetical protein
MPAKSDAQQRGMHEQGEQQRIAQPPAVPLNDARRSQARNPSRSDPRPHKTTLLFSCAIKAIESSGTEC